MRTDPIAFFQFMIYRAPAVLLALMLHEIAHGYVAYRCGDPTAKMMGRLSLNPFKHLSLIGTILMFTAGMGWAKPVPVDPRYFKNERRDDFLVSIAGVTVNFLLFLIATFLAVFVNELLWDPEIFTLGAPLLTRRDFLSFDGYNFNELLFSSKYVISQVANGEYYGFLVAESLKTPWLIHVQRFLYQFALCNLGMCLFNLLPFPPLDGFHVFNDILLRGKIKLSGQAFRYCMLALLILMSVTDIFSNLISAAIDFVQSGVLTFALSLFGLS